MGSVWQHADGFRAALLDHHEFVLGLGMFAIAGLGLWVAWNQVSTARSQIAEARTTRALGQYTAYLKALNELTARTGRWLIAYWGWCGLVAKTHRNPGPVRDTLLADSLDAQRHADGARAEMQQAQAEWQTYTDILSISDYQLAEEGEPILTALQRINRLAEGWVAAPDTLPETVSDLLKEVLHSGQPAKLRAREAIAGLLDKPSPPRHWLAPRRRPN